MIKKDVAVKDAAILVLGITFKENCSDVRNTRVVDIVRELEDFGTQVTIFDPCADPKEVWTEHGVVSQQKKPTKKFDGIVLAVAHKEFKEIDLKKMQKETSIIYDVKNYLSSEIVDKTL
jgi:UDP-N-acetyl-D-galactosamine dehydrogenase